MGRRKGTRHLVFDLVDDTSRFVETSQLSVWDRTLKWVDHVPSLDRPGRVLRDLASLHSAGVHGSIRGISGGVRGGVDALEADRDEADEGQPLHDRAPQPVFDALQAAVNGGWGSRLATRGNGLDVGFTLRDAEGRVLPVERAALTARLVAPTARIAVFVHGLGSTEQCWRPDSKRAPVEADNSFGGRLREELGYTPVYVRYNTGRRVLESGRALADAVSQLVEAYPTPVQELVLIGHSMGGLVARAAALIAQAESRPWWSQLRHVVTLGSPHTGAPLARAADAVVNASQAVDGEAARIIGAVLETRSDGVHDLSTGYGAEGAPKVDVDPDASHAVNYFFIGSTLPPAALGALSNWLGDLVVPLDSASANVPGDGPSVGRQSGVVVTGCNHMQLPTSPRVYAPLRRQLSGEPA